jgi:hypothetical protein
MMVRTAWLKGVAAVKAGYRANASARAVASVVADVIDDAVTRRYTALPGYA